MKAFGEFHPAALMMYFVGVVLVAMFTLHPVLLALALTGGICFCALLEPAGRFVKDLGFYAGVFLLIAVTNPIFSHNGVTPLFFMNGNPVTLEAILCGLAVAGMLVAVMYWFKCYNHIMTSEKFLYLFGRAVPKLALVISMAMRFLPRFHSQMKRVSAAQKAMGLYAGKGLTDRARFGFRVLAATVTWSLENAVDTADSMKARGYGLPGRSSFSLFRFTGRDGGFLAVTGLLLASVLIGLILGGGAFAFYPRVSFVSTAPLSLIVYFSYGVLCFAPFIIELEESLRWKYLQSRI